MDSISQPVKTIGRNLALVRMCRFKTRLLESFRSDRGDRTPSGGLESGLHFDPASPLAILRIELARKSGQGPSAFPSSAEVAHGKARRCLRHGTAILRYAMLSNGEPLVKGKTVMGFANVEGNFADNAAWGVNLLPRDKHVTPWRIEDELKRLGTNDVQAGRWRGFAVRDHNLITGQQIFFRYRDVRGTGAGARRVGGSCLTRSSGASSDATPHSNPTNSAEPRLVRGFVRFGPDFAGAIRDSILRVGPDYILANSVVDQPCGCNVLYGDSDRLENRDTSGGRLRLRSCEYLSDFGVDLRARQDDVA